MDEETTTTEDDAAESSEAEPTAEEAVAAVSQEVDAVSELAALEAERDKYKDQLLRTAADFDNFRKRTRKDIEQAERRGRESILLEVLPVIDNLERAVAAAETAADATAVREGVEMVLKLFNDTANKIGLAKVDSVGSRFDPNLHDAFQQQATDEHPPGTIVAEFQTGYQLNEKLLRPAMVVVAKALPEPKPDEEN